jgi:hypothetical protein
MIAITISPAAHQAIKRSLLGTADATPRPGPDGLIRISLDRKVIDRLGQMRGPGESYSDVIIRLAEGAGGSAEQSPRARPCKVIVARGGIRRPRAVGEGGSTYTPPGQAEARIADLACEHWAGSTRTRRSCNARLSLGDEAAAAVVFESCAKSRSVGPGQVDDTQSVDSLAIDDGLMYANLRSVERGCIFGVESPEIAFGVGFRFWRCDLYGPASGRGGGLIEALLGGRSLRPKQVARVWSIRSKDCFASPCSRMASRTSASFGSHVATIEWPTDGGTTPFFRSVSTNAAKGSGPSGTSLPRSRRLRGQRDRAGEERETGQEARVPRPE